MPKIMHNILNKQVYVIFASVRKNYCRVHSCYMSKNETALLLDITNLKEKGIHY